MLNCLFEKGVGGPWLGADEQSKLCLEVTHFHKLMVTLA